MKCKSVFVKILVLILIFSMISILNPVPQFAQNNKNNTKNQEIKASPKNIRESTTFYVYILWIWLVILILIYILVLKIKEVDRIYRMKFEGDREREEN